MKENSPVNTFPAVMLTLFGILIGMTMAILSVWSDYEAASYGFERRSSSPFRGLSCPVFVGINETRTISVKVSNPTDQAISPSVKTEISTPAVADSRVEYIKLSPGELVTLERTVGSQNIDLDRFIFVNAQIYTAYPMEDQENTCGIFVLPFSGSGSMVLSLGTLLSILFMAVGIFIVNKGTPSARQSRALVFMAVVTALAMLFGFMGWWIQALVLLVLFIISLWSLFSAFLLK